MADGSPFEVDIRAADDEVRVALRGELDIATAPKVEAVVEVLEKHDPKVVVLDLADLRFIDSSGTRALLTAAERARERWALRVENPPPPVVRVLELLGVKEKLLAADA